MAEHWLGSDSSRWLDIALEPILNEPRHAVLMRERSAFDQYASSAAGSIVLFGASALGRAVLSGLRKVGIEPLAFSDNRSELWGMEVEGVAVYSPREVAARFGSSATFVVTVYNGTSVREQLRKLNCTFVVPFVPLFWKYAEAFIPDQGIDLPHRIQEQIEDIRIGYTSLADEISRREFCEQIRWRFLLDYGCLSPPTDARQLYFPPEVVRPIDDEVLVDCGAYDGDSIRAFLEIRGTKFRRIYALEPDATNREGLLRFVSQLPGDLKERISVLPFAAGDKAERIAFNATSTGRSSMVSGSLAQEIECRTLDQVLREEPPTYIKMDIEAAEPAAIRGARTTLDKHAPVVAACVYHRCEHLWQIPTQLRNSSAQYSIFLRRYAEESWEMVCYAVPSSRIPT